MKNLLAFINGMVEFNSCYTTYYACYSQINSYDWGREWAHRLTFRRFER